MCEGRKKKERLTIGADAIRSKDAILANQPCLIEADIQQWTYGQHRTQNNKRYNSLDSLSLHDVQHLLSAPLVQTSPRVSILDVCLDVEALRSKPSTRLGLEGRQGGVVGEPREEGLHRVGDSGDECGSVPECNCEAKG